MRAGWAQEMKTSVVAFDIAQFFPLINHDLLLVILHKYCFDDQLVSFFGSYLVGHTMWYLWNSLLSEPRLADVGVGQGSALSPSLSALLLSLVVHLFYKRFVSPDPRADATLLSDVDNGTIAVHSPSLSQNLPVLRAAYGVIHDLLTALGLVLEYDKLEVYHFTQSP